MGVGTVAKSQELEVEVVMVVRRKFSAKNYDHVSEILDGLTNKADRDKVDAIGTFIQPVDQGQEYKNDDYESVKFYAILNGNGEK